MDSRQSIRRFHALCGSVILLDEVQSVPAKMLTLFSLAVNLLAEVCGATVVLCSATQPCMEQIGHPIHAPIPELAPYDPALWEVFRRTDIRPVAEELSLEGIAGFARECLETAESLLVVCNKKDQAEALFQVFEEDATDVVVPYGEGKGLIADLGSERAKRDPAHLKELLNKAKPYTVALYRYQLKRLEEKGGLIPLAGGALGLNGHYSEETGFSVDESNLNFLGV